MLRSETTLKVRYAETDKMGIAYHGNYFVWFEIARVHMLEELGYPYRSLEEKGYLLPVMEAQAKYKRPARFDDTLTVRLEIPKQPNARIQIDYQIYCDTTLLMTGMTSHAFMSPNGKAVRPPRDLIEMMAKYYESR